MSDKDFFTPEKVQWLEEANARDDWSPERREWINEMMARVPPEMLSTYEPQPARTTEPAPQAAEWDFSDYLTSGGGVFDEVGAAGRAIGGALGNVINGESADLSGEYDRGLASIRAGKDQYEEENPYLSTVGQVAGALATGGIGQSAATAGSSLLAKGARMAGAGAASGGLGGFAEGEGGFLNRLENAGYGAAFGTGLGLALPAAGGAIGRQFAKSRATKEALKAAPTNQQLKAAATAAYDKAQGADVVFAKDAFAGMATKLQQDLTEAGLDATLHPRANAALRRITGKAAEDVSMKDLEILRRVARAAGSGLDADERRVSGLIIDSIDEFAQNAAQDAVVSGDPNAAVESLKLARQHWAKLKKSEILDELFENAGNQASGFENGLRIQFRSLLKNKKKLRGFSDAEIKAMEQVVKGGKLENFMRTVGRFSPTSGGGATNIVGGSIGATGGYAALGPAGGVLVPGVGYGAQKLSEKLTREAAERAAALVRSGQVPQVPKTPGLIESFMSTPTSAAAGGGLLANLLAE